MSISPFNLELEKLLVGRWNCCGNCNTTNYCESYTFKSDGSAYWSFSETGAPEQCESYSYELLNHTTIIFRSAGSPLVDYITFKRQDDDLCLYFHDTDFSETYHRVL